MDITKDIQPMTAFRNHSAEFMQHLRETKRPLILTVNGRAVAVVQDAEAYQHLLDLAADASAAEGIRQGTVVLIGRAFDPGAGHLLGGFFASSAALLRERLARAVTDVQHRDDATRLVDRVDNPVDVPLVAREKMAERGVFRRNRTSGGMFVGAENSRFKSIEPSAGLLGINGIDSPIDASKVASGARRHVNAVCHARRGSR